MKSVTKLATVLIGFSCFVSPAFGQVASSTTAFARGCEQMMHKDFANAISSFTEAISDDPNDVNSYFRRGQSFFCVGNYKEAIVDFDRALAKGAMDYNVYLWKGTAYAKLDNMDLSVFNYEKAMRLNPKLVATYKSNALSKNAETTKNAESAKTTESAKTATAQSSKDSDPSSLESRIEAVRVAAAQIGATKFGAREVERVDKPKSTATLSLGNNQRPLEAYETAARKIAENEVGYFRAGTTYSGLLNLSGAVIPLSGFSGQPEWIETAQKGHPYFALKEPLRDLRELDTQITSHPQDSKLYFQRAQVNQHLGKLAETLKDLNRAIELDGANAHYFLARAFYYHRQNDDNLAEAEIRHAQDIDPIVPSDLSFDAPIEKERNDKS
ncbi:MAG: tetratricopeptide repeat protein [Cyanobacteria bacterium SZAS-4]|nr:tetratricopeptide repeat protein [Cyanobacteria bacterium SZAS-4]